MIGTQLGGYAIRSELGSGGMGKVYLAEAVEAGIGLEHGQKVALKIVHPNLLESPGFFKRFLREADIGKRVEHKNVVRTYDADAVAIEGQHYHFIVMEYVEGQTLRDLLQELGSVPEELCRHIAHEVDQALRAIHAADVVHRDLKPENVLITRDHVVKVMDLGVARLADESMQISKAGVFIGSVLYASPEQFEGEPLDGRADYYALGLLLYELATGQHPSKADEFSAVMKKRIHETPRSAAEINPQLSPFFEEVLKSLLETDRERRLVEIPAGEESDWWRERAVALREATHQPLRRIRIPRETALYGRDEDITHLRRLFTQAASGQGQFAIIEGEAGIGKTRLIDEFVGLLRQEGEDLNFLFGSYPPGGAATAAGAFSTAYREQFGEAGGAAYLTHTRSLVPGFDALLRGEPAPAGSVPIGRESMQAAFVEATAGLAQERTTIVLIDDLHFAPEEGRALFAALALGLANDRVLLFGTTRPTTSGKWLAEIQHLDHATQLSLSRLGAKEVGALLVDAFDSERLADELGFRIVTKSDGNPFFVFEIIRALREGQLITQIGDGSWIHTGVIEKIDIPSSILDLIQARISDLDEADTDLLEVAACCGFEFDPGLVADAAGVDRLPALKRFGRIEKKHRLIRSAGRHCVFDHHQVQESLYAGMLEQLREQYHVALAAAIEHRSSETTGAVAVDLVEHFFKGGEGRRALVYLDAALDHLEQGAQFNAAQHLAGEALDSPGLLKGTERARILMRRIGPLDLLGERAEEEEAELREAIELARALEDRRLEGQAGSALGFLLYRLCRYEESRKLLPAAIECARASGDFETEATGSGNLGNVIGALEGIEASLPYHERQLDISRQHGFGRWEGNALGNLAIRYSKLGQEIKALKFAMEGLRAHEKGGHTIGIAWGYGHLGSFHTRLGHHEEAKRYLELALAANRELGSRRSAAYDVARLGTLAEITGMFKEALHHFEDAAATAHGVGDKSLGIELDAALAELLVRLGDPEAAGAAARAAMVRANAELGARDRTAVAQVCGWIHRLREEPAAAQEAYEQAIEDDLSAQTADANLGLGLLLTDAGQPQKASLHFEAALKVSREVQQHSTTLLTLLAMGDAPEALALIEEQAARLPYATLMEARFLLWKATADRAHLEEAHERLLFLRDHAPEAYRETILTGHALHREIVAAWEVS